MILRYYGHAFWTAELENGCVIAFDPYGTFYDFPERSVKADYCLISHHHHDHDGLSSLQPGAQVIDTPGVHKLENGVVVRGIATFHDEVQGAKRGPNTFFVLEAEGMHIGHAGDLGHIPDAGQRSKIGHLDVAMLPVGGYYTIDGAEALDVCRLLNPTVMLPMHYRTKYDEEMPTADLKTFLQLAKAEDQQMPLLRVVKGDVHLRPEIVTLRIV